MVSIMWAYSGSNKWNMVLWTAFMQMVQLRVLFFFTGIRLSLVPARQGFGMQTTCCDEV
jgi:hypothetical protein